MPADGISGSSSGAAKSVGVNQSSGKADPKESLADTYSVLSEELQQISAKDSSILDNIDLTDEEGFTLLTKAAAAGDLQRIEYLINAGADVDLADANELTPLMYAAAAGDTATVAAVDVAVAAADDARDAANFLNNWSMSA